jgi:endonuclease-8
MLNAQWPTMPEGDTIFRAARTLERALGGQPVTRFESVFPAVNRIDEDHPIVGRTVEAVVSRGKHMLLTFSGGLTLHTHMRMNGSWHIYRPGERWQRPASDMRILVGTATMLAVGFNVPIAELLTASQLARHPQLRALGSDLTDGAFDRMDVLSRLRAEGSTFVGDALLNQRVVAGIGNVLKSEILFVAGVDPFTPSASLTEQTAARIIDVALAIMKANVLERARTLHAGIGRRTTQSMDPHARLWVYGRGGRPCRRCGKPIQSRKTGLDARVTYWCAQCQR